MNLANGDMPESLLVIEVSALLHYIPELYQHTLVATLWNTGARINEALTLTLEDFVLDASQPWVSLATLIQRQEKATRGPGAPSKKNVSHRQVPLSDPQYVNQLNMMIATLKVPLDRRDKKPAAWRPRRSGS